MESDSVVYAPFRSEKTYELTGFRDGELKDPEEVAEEVEGFVDEDTYEDLVEIYGEDELEEIEVEPQIEVSDGVGCTEIWEKMSEERESY
jgi:hypothetical protein